MKEMMNLEAQILASFVVYPQEIDEFLQVAPLKCFSSKGREILHLILSLNDEKILNESTLSLKAKTELKGTELFLQTLASLPNSNVLSLAPLLKKQYQIQMQEQIALKMQNASANKAVLDLEILSKEMELEANEFKNLSQWQHYYENQPPLPFYSCGISFLDSCVNGGFRVGQLVLISGDPEAGKTRLGVQILENISKKFKVCFFCFEFTIQDYLQSLEKCKKQLRAENMILINDGFDIHEVIANIKALYKKGVRVFFIDSQMRISSFEGSNMEEKESFKFSSLAKLAHSLGLLIFLVIQNSKEDRENPMGSKKGGHEANIIIRIERIKPDKNDYAQKLNEFDENARLFLVKKNKQTGKHFKEKVHFNTQDLRFYALSNEPERVEFEISQKELEKAVQDDIF